jgi:hypothetical protein
MVRRAILWATFCAAMGFAVGSAQAGDRKPAAVDRSVLPDRVVTRAESPASLRHDAFTSSVAAVPEQKNSRVKRDLIEESAAVPSSERKQITLFHINSKFGDVAVQPVFGSIQGAQFSIGF